MSRVFCCRKWVVALLVLLLLQSGRGAVAESIVLSGSTTVQERILEPSRAAIEQALGVTMRIKGIGSGGGFRELLAGRVEASLSSSPLEWLLSKYGISGAHPYQQHTISEDLIVPIIHPSNPVESLSWQQLADIHSGKIRNWREVGGEDRSIVVITSHLDSATRAVFQQQVM